MIRKAGADPAPIAAQPSVEGFLRAYHASERRNGGYGKKYSLQCG
jgi:hypothetical protein